MKERTYLLTEPQKGMADYINIKHQNDSVFYNPKLETHQNETALYANLSSLQINGKEVSSYGEYLNSASESVEELKNRVDMFFEPVRLIQGVQYNKILGILHQNSGSIG